jgi:hypothetical protein
MISHSVISSPKLKISFVSVPDFSRLSTAVGLRIPVLLMIILVVGKWLRTDAEKAVRSELSESAEKARLKKQSIDREISHRKRALGMI